MRDPQDFSYKVTGLLAWATILFCIGGLFAFPRAILLVGRIFAFYMIVRFVLIAFFYVLALTQIRRGERRPVAASGAVGVPLANEIHHVVIVPNYKEPTAILERTLRSLAMQQDAQRRLTVVLAMEEMEPDACAKGEQLAAQFRHQFARVLVSVHPAKVPGEVAGKGANQAWAARWAKRLLVDEAGLDLDKLTLTSCDADSVIHPRYFAELARLFAADPHRHRRIWQPPLLLDNNIREVAIPIRLLSYFSNIVHLSELCNPVALPMPLSTYTLSYRLADEVGYWDPAVISEDWHMLLRCFFATRGQTKVVPVYLPTKGDAVTGNSTPDALLNFYRQQLRRAWGGQDVGYILQQWAKTPSPPLHKKLLRLVKIIHDHLVFSIAGVILVTGTLASFALTGSWALTLPTNGRFVNLLLAINALGGISAVSVLIAERLRIGGMKGLRGVFSLLTELGAWLLFSVVIFVVASLPVLHAQTRMALGLPLAYFRTPKRLGPQAAS